MHPRHHNYFRPFDSPRMAQICCSNWCWCFTRSRPSAWLPSRPTEAEAQRSEPSETSFVQKRSPSLNPHPSLSPTTQNPMGRLAQQNAASSRVCSHRQGVEPATMVGMARQDCKAIDLEDGWSRSSAASTNLKPASRASWSRSSARSEESWFSR